MKKGKLNNKGFVLVETLVVSVFIAAILAVLYNNFYPLMGEYEKREVFDDIDGKYSTYWIKRIIQHDGTNIGAACSEAALKTSPYYCMFNCSMVGNDSMKAMCYQFLEKAQVRMDRGPDDTVLTDDTPRIYITTYKLEYTPEGESAPRGMKTYVDLHGGVSGGMQRYLKFLPNYRWDSLNNAKYRVLVEFHRTRDGNDYFAYSTFEVIKG